MKCLNRTITTVIFLSVSWRHISLISYLRWISGISWTERSHYRNRMLYPCQTSFRCCTYGIKKDFTKEQLKETIAYQAMTRIGILYKVEELIKDKTPEERYQELQKQSRPVVDVLFEWLHSMEDSVDRSSLIGDAILYTLNQETYLRRYLDDGHLSIDNNSAERSIKNFVVAETGCLPRVYVGQMPAQLFIVLQKPPC